MSTELSTTNETAIRTTGSWKIDPAHTQVGFAVKHLMISTVRGRFTGLSGSVEVDPATGAPAVDASIDVASLATGDEKRDAHLRSADFFQADAFPTIRFTSRGFEGDLEGRFQLFGDLTIRGTTRRIALDVVNEGTARDPWGGERLGVTATTRLSRKDFGLEWNVALETGGVLVGDEVRISIEAQLVRQ